MRWWTLLSLLVLTLLVGCKQQTTPKVDVLKLDDRHDDKAGLILDLHCRLHNPYSYALVIDRADADVYLEGIKVRNTTVQAQGSTTVPPHGSEQFVVHVLMAWSDMAKAFGQGNSKGKTIGLRIDGNLKFDRISEPAIPVVYTGKLDRMRLFLDSLKYIPLPNRKKVEETCGGGVKKDEHPKPGGRVPLKKFINRLKFPTPAASH